MFGPCFLEGQAARSASEPKETLLPDDDAVAMQVLLAMLHHGRQFTDESKYWLYISPAMLSSITILADKYDCTTSIASLVDARLEIYTRHHDCTRGSIHSAVQDWHLATAAFLCQLKHRYAAFTRCLILGHTESLQDLRGATEDSPMPDHIVDDLIEARAELRFELILKITNAALPFCCSSILPGTDLNGAIAVVLGLSCWPPNWEGHSIHDVLERAQSTETPLRYSFTCKYQVGTQFEHKWLLSPAGFGGYHSGLSMPGS
ncbi:hypothetical protein LTR56_004810 [Elasticomyces elasticus]|nr:hypothetical protein LTR56_004810 [Elasticomyces elasticus]KAK3664584.1 hypothetical protein LTR22_004452 [Elasticomyces elasticus]KAK4918448.1 hypothetical protein LTR49_013840 [Elasticomyces elasticus]KAK5760294.1 hypothetical protein LTS12_009508 [Elasticomyces elasticus]